MIPLLNRGGVMKGFVQGADRQQTTLLPECLDDWVDLMTASKNAWLEVRSGSSVRRKSSRAGLLLAVAHES
jgi:hypothetical protein